MMSNNKAPRVFVTYSHDSADHKDQVLRFATFLRTRIGLDVRLDQWYDNSRRDWSLWAIEHLRDADFVLVIASPDYKRRADGAAPPTELHKALVIANEHRMFCPRIPGTLPQLSRGLIRLRRWHFRWR
ncbi:SEFIR domain-containing protein [Kibdelosporangium lantanae]|uniref:SEFIR domain-containing protein n=1 Tax=Kibdelosporangium lantanae TaxID=1497396 RepID=A0ABW3MAJ1_9PSEU